MRSKLKWVLMTGLVLVTGACGHRSVDNDRSPAAASTNYLCRGQKFDDSGRKKGIGTILVMVMGNQTVRLVDRDESGASPIDLLLEGPDSSGTAQVYRTTSTKKGLGLVIQNVNLKASLDSQAYLYVFPISQDQAGAHSKLDCRVSKSSILE